MVAHRREPSHLFPTLTVLFVAIVWVVTMADPSLQRWQTAVPFTLLCLTQAALHARLGRVQTPPRAILYLAVQCALVVAMCVITEGRDLVLALFFPVMGEALGLLKEGTTRLPALAGIVAVWGATMLLTMPAPALATRAPAHLLSLLFVGTYVTLFMRQSRERERAEELLQQLEQAHGQLRAYALQVEEMSITQERQRMARELHDTLAQGLAGLIMQLEAVDSLLERNDSVRAREVTRRAMDRARATLREARTAISALRSPLEQGDLAEAIRRLLESLQADTGIAGTLEAGPGNLRVSEPLRLHLYRTVQEGLANVARHSRARQVLVRLQEAGRQIRLEIVDDGVGFDPAMPAPSGHYGLLGLQERMRLAGGQLLVESRPGGGTRLVATLPAPSELEE